jgi:hypothetical protein
MDEGCAVFFVALIVIGAVCLWLDKHPMVVAALGSIVAWVLVLAAIGLLAGIVAMLNDRPK